MIKAVVFDIDGTAIPNKTEGMPSQRLIGAVRKARESGLRISCASGRNYEILHHIIEALGLSDPCIVSAGTRIVDPRTGRELWSEHMSEASCRRALAVLAPYKLKILVDGDTHDTAKTSDEIEPKAYRMLDIQHAKATDIVKIIEELSKDASLTVIPVRSSSPDSYFIHVTDKLATKEVAVRKLIEILGVSKNEAVGVGDDLNDLELFKSVGHKVAMGNAIDDLKNAADEVIESIEDDGLAIYLERLCE